MLVSRRLIRVATLAAVLLLVDSRGAGGAGTCTSLIIGTDDRWPVTDTTRLPHSAVCKLRVEFPTGMVRVSSGVLVGPRTVLTAGHVIHNETFGGVASRVEAYPGYDRGRMPFGRCFATGYQSLTGWSDPSSADYDFALVTLNRDVGWDAGWLDVEWKWFHSEFEGLSLTLAGYPCDLEAGGAQYRSDGVGLRADNRRIYYGGTMDTCKGQSGSPVWRSAESAHLVVGVHEGAIGALNQASRITEKVANWIVAARTDTKPLAASFCGQAEECRMRRRNRDRLGLGETRAYEFTLDPAVEIRRMRFRTRGAVARVVRPDGTEFPVDGRCDEASPEAGRWRVLLTGNREGARRRVRLRVKPIWRR